MRYLILMLLFAGCGPGPKSAHSAPPTKDTIVQALERYDALSVKRDETAATKLESLAETVGNNTAELELVKEELRAVKSGVESLNKLLTVDTELSIPVPPVKLDAPPIEAPRADPTVMLNGQRINADALIAQHFKRMWSFPGDIDSHLAEHGVSGAEGLDDQSKRQLHSALHEMGNAPAVKSRTVVKQSVAPRAYSAPGCPNGQCPTGRQPAYYQSRTRLLGRWR